MYLGPTWAWYCVVLIAVVVASLEVFGMTHAGDRIAQGVGTACSVAVSFVLYFHNTNALALLTTALLLPIVGLLVPLWRLGDVQTAALRIMSGMATPLYVGGTATSLALLRSDFPGYVGPGLVLMTLTISWLSDIGGYFGGRYYGKTKLYPAVSPKKTREGYVGGLVGGLVAALLAHFWYLPQISLVPAVALGVVGSAIGQLGDLGESLLKRSTGIKDSGSIIPGHGGMMDRIDAVLIVSPLVYLSARWLLLSQG